MWWLLCSFVWAGTVDKVLGDLDQELGVYDQLESTKTNNPFRDVEAYFSNDRWRERSAVEMGFKFKLKPYQEWQLSRIDATNADLVKRFNKSSTLKNRFEVLLGYKQNTLRVKLYQEAIHKYDQLIKVQQLDIVSGKSDGNSLLNSRGERESLLADLKTTEINRENLKHLLTLWTGESEIQDDYDFVSMQSIRTNLVKLPKKQATMTDQLRQEELSQIEKEMKILRARDRQWLNEVEIKKNDISREEDYEIGVKFRIPLLSSDSWARQKINELLIKRTLKQRELREQVISVSELGERVSADIDRYQKLSQAKLRAFEADAQGLLNVELKKVKNRIEALDLQESIYLQYIYILFEMDSLKSDYLVGSKHG